MTDREKYCEVLNQILTAGKALAVHEFDRSRMNISQNNLSTRLSEWARAGYVNGNFRPGTNYKEWSAGGMEPVNPAPKSMSKVERLQELIFIMSPYLHHRKKCSIFVWWGTKCDCGLDGINAKAAKV